jgi:UDP-3-O-[3-hydroxymyristoyl] N-acetylglucosamine deacetylase
MQNVKLLNFKGIVCGSKLADFWDGGVHMHIRLLESGAFSEPDFKAQKALSGRTFSHSPHEVIDITGVGIHTGKKYRLQVTRAPQGHQGILFCSLQSDAVFSAPSRWTRLSGTTRSTALVLRGESKRKIELRTVEHFLAAAFVSGLRDLVVNIQMEDGSDSDILEMPILEGAALQWWNLLSPLRIELEKSTEATLKDFKVWVPVRSYELVDASKRVLISPLENMQLHPKTYYSCQVFFEPAWRQELDFEISWMNPRLARQNFAQQIAPARTFGFMHELKALEARGLAKGGSLMNAIVLDGDKIVNPEGFKLPQELAAHKLLDAIGDFALLEYPVLGRIDLHQAGHSMHLRALEEAVRTGALVQASISL